MMIYEELNPNDKLTEEQLAMLLEMEASPAEPDEDCPELTEEQLSQCRRISKANREKRCKQTVTIRLSPQALAKARSLGKGYTSVLSRILENALNDIDTIHHNL
jgi:uncharacterized protein (DUF4415 family)